MFNKGQDDLQEYLIEDPDQSFPSREEELALSKAFKDSEHPAQNIELTGEAKKARDELVSRNLRLVISIARQYMNRGIDLEDLVQEGNVGLLKAADRYNPALGFKFSTYSTWWIRQAVTRAIADQSRLIRVPVHVTETLSKVAKAYKQVAGIKKYTTPEDIAEKADLPVDRVRALMGVMQAPISLHIHMTDTNLTLDELLVAPDEGSAETYEKTFSCIEQALLALPEREKQVLELRYGIGRKKEVTLEDVGKKLGITRERVRQIEIRALRHLRANYITDTEPISP